MKTIIFKLLRLPIDLILVTIDLIRSLPEIAARVIRKRKMCTFCELARIDSSSSERPCHAANKYGNTWIFRAVCPCARPADENHRTPFCPTKNPYDRRLWHLPFTAIGLAGIWLAIAVGALELAGKPAAKILANKIRGIEEPQTVLEKPAPTPTVASEEATPTAEPPKAIPAPQIDHEKYEKALTRAEEAIADGAFDQARIAYMNALRHNPASGPANQGLGRCYLVRGQFANALDAFETAAELDPELPELQLQLAEVHAHRAAHTRALKHALAHHESDPHDPRGHLYLMRIYNEQSNNASSDEAANWLVQSPDTSFDQLTEVGEYLVRRGKLDEAQTLFEKLAESPSHPIQGLQGLAQIQIARGALDEASATLLAARKLETNSVHTAVLQADLFMRQGETQKSLAAYEQLFEKHPNEPKLALAFVQQLDRAGNTDRAISIAERVTRSGSPLMVRDAKMALANMYLGKKLYRNAQRYVDEVLQVDPQHADARYLRAQCLLGQKQLADAEKEIRSVLETQPEHTTARTQLSQLMLSDPERKDEAIQELESLAKFMPDNPAPLGRIAMVYFNRGDFAKTIEAANRALERQADAPLAANRLVLALIETGEHATAITRITPMYEGNPSEGYLADAYGWAVLQNDQVDDALKALEHANTRLRGPLMSHHLGAAYAKKDDVKNARKHLERALEFDVPFIGKEKVEALLKDLP